MTHRRNFPRSVREQIVRRAKNAAGFPVCEGCGGVLKRGAFEIDHILAEALVVDKSKPLTAEDGQLLGYCCHRGENGKTANDVRTIAKAKRMGANHDGYARRTSRPVDGSKASRFKKKMNGNVELR